MHDAHDTGVPPGDPEPSRPGARERGIEPDGVQAGRLVPRGEGHDARRTDHRLLVLVLVLLLRAAGGGRRAAAGRVECHRAA
ncbi:hypothetical protein [Streptomyces sp. bgisy022]|uniref:hypothetical protein n=1 Tax=Streptomyces sp. bgisy022 TaxID=3413769 RepID=UPI003D719274